jgi:hypothetical protein
MCVYTVQSALLNHIFKKKVAKMSYLCKISCHIDVNVLAEKFSSFFHMAGPPDPGGSYQALRRRLCAAIRLKNDMTMEVSMSKAWKIDGEIYGNP